VPITVESKCHITIIDNTVCLKMQSTQPPLFIVCLCGNFPSALLLAFHFLASSCEMVLAKCPYWKNASSTWWVAHTDLNMVRAGISPALCQDFL